MKQNKGSIAIAIVIAIIIILVGAIVFLAMQFFTKENSKNTSNPIQIEEGNLQNKEKDKNEVQNSIKNEVQNPITPILNNINENGANSSTTPKLISNTYYYNQLDSNGKMIYDALKKNKKQLETGTYQFDFGTQFNTLLHTENGEKELGKAFQSAWNAFYYDEPDLFYIDITKMTLLTQYQTIGGITTYSVSIGPAENSNYLKENFQTKEQIQMAQKFMQNIVNQVVEQTKQDSAVEKVRRIHNWLVSSVEYDSMQNSINKGHIYGALYDKKAVCEGYARSLKYLVESVGVPCILVSGTGTNSQGVTETHAWNYVQIENKWYAVDVTWDDPIVIGEGEVSKEVKYKYFLKGTTTFLKDHKEDGVISENSMKFNFPTLNAEDYVGF